MIFVHQNQTVFFFGKASKEHIIHFMFRKEAINKLALKIESELILENNQTYLGGFILKTEDFNGLFRQFEAVFFCINI